LHISGYFWKLALKNLVIRNEFRAPPAGGDRFEIGFQIVYVASEGSANLVIGEKVLPGERVGDVRQKPTPQFIDVLSHSVLWLESFDERAILLPPRFDRFEKARVRSRYSGISLDQLGQSSPVGPGGSEVGIQGVATSRFSRSRCEDSLAQSRIVLPEDDGASRSQSQARPRGGARARRAARAAARCPRSAGCCSCNPRRLSHSPERGARSLRRLSAHDRRERSSRCLRDEESSAPCLRDTRGRH